MAVKSKAKSTMLTRNGKTRLGPLNVAQLTKMLETGSKPKELAKIRNALARRVKTQAVSTKVVEVAIQLED